MRNLTAAVAMMVFVPLAAAAQDAVPTLKGTWQGTGKILLYGSTEHLSGSPGTAVVRDLRVSHTVEGQDGRLMWGTTSSANNDSKEPFAWAMSSDNKTILGAALLLSAGGNRFLGLVGTSLVLAHGVLTIPPGSL